MSPIHYLPLTSGFFAILVGLFLLLVAMIQVGILRYAYMRLGVSSGAALLLLLGSLIGSYINIPVVQLPEQHILSGRHVEFFGVHYSVPVVIDWPGTVVAINVGGALIPTLMSLYLLAKNQVWGLSPALPRGRLEFPALDKPQARIKARNREQDRGRLL